MAAPHGSLTSADRFTDDLRGLNKPREERPPSSTPPNELVRVPATTGIRMRVPQSQRWRALQGRNGNQSCQARGVQNDDAARPLALHKTFGLQLAKGPIHHHSAGTDHGCQVGSLGNWMRGVEDHFPIPSEDERQPLAGTLKRSLIEPHIENYREFRRFVEEADGQARVPKREVSHESRIPGRPRSIGQGDELVNRLGIRVADRAKSAEVPRSRDQRSSYLSSLRDASGDDVPIENNEGRQLDSPRVQHIATREGMALGSPLEAMQRADISARQ